MGAHGNPAPSCVCHSVPTHAIRGRGRCAWTSAVPGGTRTGSGGGTPSAGLVVSGIWCPPLSKSLTAGTPWGTQAPADRLPNTIEAASWPPVRAPIPPKTACRSAAWQARVPAGITVGDGVASGMAVGVALIQGTGAVGSFFMPAARCEPAAQPHRVMARTARSRERARIYRYNGSTRQELPKCLAALDSRPIAPYNREDEADFFTSE